MKNLLSHLKSRTSEILEIGQNARSIMSRDDYKKWLRSAKKVKIEITTAINFLSTRNKNKSTDKEIKAFLSKELSKAKKSLIQLEQTAKTLAASNAHIREGEYLRQNGRNKLVKQIAFANKLLSWMDNPNSIPTLELPKSAV